MKALILIDIQNDFLPGGSLPVPHGDEIIPVANRIQQAFDLVLATQDWHPANHKSFASSHEGKNNFDVIEWMGAEQVLWPEHCIQGTTGAAFSLLLNMERSAVIFRKGMSKDIDSYSGFYDNGHLNSTGLSFYLRGLGVEEVYLAGLAADFCVYFTAKDALSEGFRTYVVDDATRAISADGLEKAKKDIANRGGYIISSASIINGR